MDKKHTDEGGMFFELDYGNIKVDSKDKKIISFLGNNCRTTINEIARKSYASKDSIRYRIMQLKSKDIYRRNITILNPFALGFSLYSILIKIRSISREKEDKFIDFLKTHPFIIWAGHTQGVYDFNIVIIAKDIYHFDLLLKKILSMISESVKEVKVLHGTKIYAYNTVPTSLIKESFGNAHETKSPFFGGGLDDRTASIYDEKVSLSAKEILVLKEISSNADALFQEVYKRIKVKPDTVRNTIKSLVEKKAILAFRGLFNVSYLNYHGYILYTKFTSEVKKEEVEAFENYIKKSDFVAFAASCSGSYYDSVVYILSKNHLEFNKTIREIKNKFSGIISETDIDLILKDYQFTFFPRGVLPLIKEIGLRLLK